MVNKLSICDDLGIVKWWIRNWRIR